MESNKLVAGFCATFLAFLMFGFIAEQIYAPYHGKEQKLAFALEIEESGGGEEEEEIDLASLLAAADPAKGEKVFKKCGACHAIEDGANKSGPHLWSIINRQIGAVGDYGYSGKLPTDQAWTAENLFAFLEAPKKWAPGTSMGFAGLKKPEDRAALIVYLNEADGTPEPLE